MAAIHAGLTWSARQMAALVLGLALIVLLAGGAGGYLIRGATTLVVTRTATQRVVVPTPSPFSVRTSSGYIAGL
jgi:hypothetical protein